MCTRFCLCPPRPESLVPPVLWKSCNQIPLAFKVNSLGIPSPFVRSPSWKAWRGVQNLHNSGRSSLVLLFSSLWVMHPAGMGFDFTVTVPLLLSCCSFFFVFGCGHLFFFFGRFQCPSVDGYSTASCDLVLLQEEMSAHPSTLPFWTGSSSITSLN